MTTEEHLLVHDRQIAEIMQAIKGLVTAAEAHDRQIEALIIVAEQQRASIADMGRQWQAYINTLPRQ